MNNPDEKSESRVDSHSWQTWAKEGLDCRHRLTSKLSVETRHAFDDVMNDVARYREKQAHLRSKGGYLSISAAKYEVLMTVSGGWVYALADREDRELYIYLDSNDYVTIADAEKAIREVRGAVLHEFCSVRHATNS